MFPYIVIHNLTNIYTLNNRTQGKSDAITMDQLITFLNEKQRDPRLNEILYPLYDEKRTIEIINDYEQDPALREQSKYNLYIGTYWIRSFNN